MAIRILLSLLTFAFAFPAFAVEPSIDMVIYDKGRGTKANGNGKIDGNEQLWVMFYVTNRTAQPLKGLTLEIAAKNARFEKNTIKLEEIAPGKRIRAATRLVAPADPGEIRVLSEIKGGGAWPPYIFTVSEGAFVQLDPTTGQNMFVADLSSGMDALAAQIVKSIPAGATKIAVAPFANLGQAVEDKQLGQVVADLLATRLRSRPGLTVIPGADIEDVLEENKIPMLALTQSKYGAYVGRKIGADIIIAGSISEVSNRFAIATRQLNVADGNVAFSKEILVPQESAIAASSAYLVQRRSTGSTRDLLFRSMLLPGWGQYYNDDTYKAAAFTGLTAALAGTAIYMHTAQIAAHQDYKNAASQNEAITLRDERDSLFESRNTVMIVAGAVWAINVVDAIISGGSVATPTSRAASGVETTISPIVSVTPDGSSLAMLDVKF